MTVTASQVVTMAQSQIGSPYSGTYDSLNGNHAWAYWCQAFVESTHRNLGLAVTPQASALSASYAYDLRQGRAPYGSVCWFGTSFYYPDGHTGISMGDGRLLGTLTNGQGVGYMWWNEGTSGFLGWSFYDEVVSDSDTPPAPPPDNWFVQPNNPYQLGGEAEIGIGGGFLRFYNTIAQTLDPMVVLGYATERETTAVVTDIDSGHNQRTVQRFERGTLIYQPENSYPHDVVMAPLTSDVDTVMTALP